MENLMESQNIETQISSLFSEKSRLQLWMDVETALAKCQAEMGIIPENVAEDIAAKDDVSNIDIELYRQKYIEAKHPLVPLLALFRQALGASGEYLHVGATTHDIVDLAKMVTLKKLWNITIDVLKNIDDKLVALAEEHAETVMAGRTHNIQALPITFGWKASVWADEIHRDIERLEQAKERIFVGTFSGAAGTMASFEGRGKELEAKISEELGLKAPVFSWHPARDRFAEAACILAIVGGTLGRIAQEVYLLMGTEIRELSEGYREGLVGSSAMPHKINPINCQHIMGDARNLRYDAAHCIECMAIDHEHNLVHFNDERTTLEHIGLTMADLLSRAMEMVSTLYIDKSRMRKNLDILQGAMQSEHVMLELGKKIGKMSSKDIITQLSVKAVREDIPLAKLLEEDKRVNEYFTPEEIESMLDPVAYSKTATDLTIEYVKLYKEGYQS